MKIALHMRMDAAHVAFARQLGLRYAVSELHTPGKGYLELDELVRAKEYFLAAGLDFDVIENLPVYHYNKIEWGLPGREEQMENVLRTIRNVGQAGIHVLQYQWMLLGGLRTDFPPLGRGGARVSRFELAVAERNPLTALAWWASPEACIRLPDRELSAEQVWDGLTYFLKNAVPVAEEAGVKLAAHPDDAPIPTFMGVARVLSSLEGLQRLVDTVPSPNNGLGFCQGTIATMAGVDMIEAIRRFGKQNKIFFAHFRNPRGAVPDFDEVFPDEGSTQMLAAVKAYREVGFDGVVRIDHAPGVVDDNATTDRAFAFQVGYLKGLIETLDAFAA